MGATADDHIRAFALRDGKDVWQARLPASGQAGPMTWRGSDGRQHGVIAAGGYGGLRTRNGGHSSVCPDTGYQPIRSLRAL